MKSIIISNYSFYDKDFGQTFSYQEEYNFFGKNSGTSTLLPMYKELLYPVLGDKMDETFRDFALSKENTEEIQRIFESKIDETLPDRELKTPYNRRMEWRGKVFDLNMSLVSPNNRSLWDFYTIVVICKECLAENRPMFLSIN